MTSVVNLRKSKYDVYIGRGGPYGNPFVIGKDGSREDVLRKYHSFLFAPEQAGLREKIKELKGKRLGCFCKPLACHGDIIQQYIDAPS